MPRRAAALLLAALVPGSALAQTLPAQPTPAPPPARAPEQVTRAAEAVAGRPLRLGLYGNLGRDCAEGPLPKVSVTAPPRHGAVRVRTGKLRPGAVARCPGVAPAAEAVFYEPDARHTGPDALTYEVRHAGGRLQAITVRFTVRPAGGRPLPKEGDGATEL